MWEEEGEELKGMKGVEGQMGGEKGGQGDSNSEQVVDRADRNWLRGQSCLLLTMQAPCDAPVPTAHSDTLSEPCCPGYPPPIPSRSPGPPSGQQCPSALLYVSLTATNPNFPMCSPCPWNLSFTSRLS